MLRLLTAALFGLTIAAPASSISHVLHERRDLTRRAEADWHRRAPVPQGRELPVRIGLTQSNLDYGDSYLMEV